MKAHEAPEKIYIDDPTGEFDDHWYTTQNDESIEYTRTNALIDKVCEWLRTNHDDIFLRYVRGYSAEDEIELLKKYIEEQL